ncbi:MAG: M20/M25/M40 family metallo-hydrolase [Pseudomonadota bacterium]
MVLRLPWQGMRLLLLLGVAAVVAAAPVSGVVDPLVLGQVRDAAMQDVWAYPQLAALTDRIGPRLSGSVGLEVAVQQVAEALRGVGATVTLQPVKVPHWVRGVERAELVDYVGRPKSLTQSLHLVALGDSGATPADGLTAPVVVVHSVEELATRDVQGRIVLINMPFDQRLADNGYAGDAYGQAGEERFVGPMTASKRGALATLVRSVGDAQFRLPHTGVTAWEKDQQPMPAAALAAEDADLIDRLAAAGPVRLHLVLTPQHLPDAESYNVVADWVGRERPDEVVVVGGHLDSWDLGTGAIDDGAGVMAAAGVIETLARLGLHPRRSIRFVAFTNEENGGRGGKAYAEAAAKAGVQHVAAIECDMGAGRALGIQAAVTPAAMARLKAVVTALQPIGATVLLRREGVVGADIRPLQLAGAPGFAPVLDGRHYFDYHHTAADTLDKVNPENLRSEIAVMAVLAYFLAETPDPLPRARVQDEE